MTTRKSTSLVLKQINIHGEWTDNGGGDERKGRYTNAGGVLGLTSVRLKGT